MRVLIVHPLPGPDFSVADVYEGWAEALKAAGCEVAGYNLNDRLIFYSMALLDTGEKDEEGHPIVRQAMSHEEAWAAAMQGLSHSVMWMWPDIVLFISAFFTTAPWYQLLRARRIKTVILHTESPYQDDEQLVRGSLADLNLLNDPTNLERFRQDGPAEYMPHAYRPSLHRPRQGPRDPDRASDLCFIGTAFRSRIEFFEAMDLNGIDVLIGGNDWGTLDPESKLARYVGSGIGNPDCVDNAQAVDLYQHAKAGINFYRREAEDTWTGDAWAMGPREVEMAATGLFFLRDPRGESDEVFGSILPSFDGPGDASEKLRWWLAHDAEREAAAEKAQAAVADRTFDSNVKRFLELTGEL
jgi:spore maturation protein CgeB